MIPTQETTTVARLYEIDKAHSEVAFQVRHLLTKVRGRFSDFSGTIRFDPQHPEESSVSVTIDASSVDTDTTDRDNHLRSDDFFAVGTHPTIAFTSSRVTRKTPESFDVDGTLTIRGISKDVTLPVTFLGTAKDPYGNTRAGFETGIKVNRKDFGLLWNAALETGGFLVGDDVQISLQIQAVAQ